MNNDGTLGNAIRNARKDYPYTLEELGKEVGVTHAFLSRVENNKVKPNDELLENIAEKLDPFNTLDLKNEFKILTGKYDDIDKNSDLYKELKSSGRLEISSLGPNKGNSKLVEKPFYKLNYLFENDYKVFYDIKTSRMGEKVGTIELPMDIMDKLYKEINLTIMNFVKENPYLLKSIDDPNVINEYNEKEQNKRDELYKYIKYLNTNDAALDFMHHLFEEDDLI